MLIDESYGRSTRAVLIMDSDHVVLSALQPETVANRVVDYEDEEETEQDSDEAFINGGDDTESVDTDENDNEDNNNENDEENGEE